MYNPAIYSRESGNVTYSPTVVPSTVNITQRSEARIGNLKGLYPGGVILKNEQGSIEHHARRVERAINATRRPDDPRMAAYYNTTHTRGYYSYTPEERSRIEHKIHSSAVENDTSISQIGWENTPEQYSGGVLTFSHDQNYTPFDARSASSDPKVKYGKMFYNSVSQGAVYLPPLARSDGTEIGYGRLAYPFTDKVIREVSRVLSPPVSTSSDIINNERIGTHNDVMEYRSGGWFSDASGYSHQSR